MTTLLAGDASGAPQAGERLVTVGRGELAFAPRGVPHAFKAN